MGHLIAYVSLVVVASLAMRPKLSLAIVATLPVSLALYENFGKTPLPDWVMISGVVASAYALAAVIASLLFRRTENPFSDGDLPTGLEMSYSRADIAGLWYTFTLLVIAAELCILGAIEPPYGDVVTRVIALVLAPFFIAFAIVFWRLLRDSHIFIQVGEHGLEVNGTFHPWSDVAGHTFWCGIFRVYDKSGRLLLRVDNIIDGFPALLYHVNRKTLPR